MDIKILEKSGAIRFLAILLSHGGSMPLTELMYTTKINSQTFYARKNELKDIGLITQEGKLVEKDGRVVKMSIISLTPLGKKIAKKLLEIKEIMEKEDKS